MGCSGIAFADFGSAENVDAAVARSGMKVCGETVFVAYETKQKKDHGPSAYAMKETSAETDKTISPGKKKKKQKKEEPKGEKAEWFFDTGQEVDKHHVEEENEPASVDQ